MSKPSIVIGAICLYLTSYGIARLYFFHAIEHYPDQKSGLRRDYISFKQGRNDLVYNLFFPAIKLEENMRILLYN